MQPIYNDAALARIDDLLEELNDEQTTDQRRDELEELLIGLAREKEERVDLLYKSVINAEAESAMLEPQLKRLSERKRLAAKKMATAERLLSFLVGEGNKIETLSGGKIGWRKSTKTIVFGDIPNQYRKPGEAMLTEIKKAILAGEDVPGARLEQSQNIQIR